MIAPLCANLPRPQRELADAAYWRWHRLSGELAYLNRMEAAPQVRAARLAEVIAAIKEWHERVRGVVA